MADDTPEPSVPAHDAAPDLSRRPRTPPTLDLEASRVEDDPLDSDAADDARAASDAPSAETARSATRRGSLFTGAAGGAVAALVVVGAAWWLGGHGGTSALDTPTVATLETLGARLNRLETAPAPVARPDPALTARLDAVDASLAGLREQLETERARNEGLGQSIEALTATAHEAPAKDAAAAPETAAPAAAPEAAAAATDARLAQVDTTLKGLADDVATLRAAQAKQDQAIAAEPQRAAADDAPLRRAVVAVALELAVRQGAPFAAELAAARQTMADASALTPLQPFADTGLPDQAALGRELRALLPKETASNAAETAPRSGSWWERLEAGAARLIRIRRIDDADADADSPGLAKVASAAQRGDLAGADVALAVLPEAVRAPFQPWRDTFAKRNAALAAARGLAASSASALSKTSSAKTSAPQAPQ